MIIVRDTTKLSRKNKIRLFSDLYTEQKEYGIISNLKHSGLKRSLKKVIGNSRKKLAEKIDNSIRKDLSMKLKAETTGKRLSEELQNSPESTKLAERRIKELKKRRSYYN